MKKSRVILKDTLKQVTLDQDKALDPDETVKRFYKKAKKIGLNILDHTVRIDNKRLDIPVYFSICGKDAKAVTGTSKQMGKGATPQQAKASAVMELAERFSFFSFYNNPENFITASYNNLSKDVISFDLIAKSVHDDSSELDISRKLFSEIPLKWTYAYNLTKNRDVLIPLNWFYTINEFNGPSAGNTPEEAISQGICEIVERHVSSVISREKLSVPLIELSSATDKMVVDMINKYKKAGIKLYASDFTMNMGIPSVGVLAYDPKTFPEKSEIVWTAGTTPDPQKALSRALSETAQLSGDFNTGSNYIASGLPKPDSLNYADFIINSKIKTDINLLPDISNKNIKTEVENCIAELDKRDMDIIVLNTTHQGLEIPAFYTIVPGAHFRERAINTSVGMFSAKIIYESMKNRDAFEKLLEFDQKLPDKYYNKFYLGCCYLTQNNPAKALDLFCQSIDLNPYSQDLASIYSYMGVCYKDMGKYEFAIDILKKGESIDKKRTDIYNLLGFCCFKLKEYKKAISYFKKIIALDPSSAIDYANIGSNYHKMNQLDQAIKYYEIAIELDPSIKFAQENINKIKKMHKNPKPVL